jgi:hypothetical protein
MSNYPLGAAEISAASFNNRIVFLTKVQTAELEVPADEDIINYCSQKLDDIDWEDAEVSVTLVDGKEYSL